MPWCSRAARLLACDAAIVGIGIVPSIGPLIAAGAPGANGLDVDEFCRTILDDVYAIGDCAAHANTWADNAIIRLESVQNAHDMAKIVALHIMDTAEPTAARGSGRTSTTSSCRPSASTTATTDRAARRPGSRSFSVIYLRAGKWSRPHCVNAIKDYVQGHKLVEAQATIAPEALMDTTRPLKELL